MVLFLGIIFILAMCINWNKKGRHKAPPIDNLIESKKQELSLLENQIQNKTIDRTVGLRNIEVKVLDLYDKSGIRIPVEIIEDLVYMNLETEEEIYKYIENQRYYWKLENTKKPYKG